MPQNGRKPHDDAGYRRRRAQLMASITADTRCWRCGKKFDEHPPHRNGTPGRWEVGHVIDGDNRGPLRIEHSTCNRRAGGRLGYARGIGRVREADGYAPVGPHFPGHYDLSDPAALTAPPCVQRTGSLCATCSEFRQQDRARH